MSVYPRLSGGIGNRLFQLYAADDAARSWNLKLHIVKSMCEQTYHGSLEDFYMLFPVEHTCTQHFTMFNEDKHFVHTPWPDCPGSSVLLNGYFQSPKYFPNPRLVPNWENVIDCAGIKAASRLDETQQLRTWMIHFRQGDYKDLLHHQVSLHCYYMKCISKIPNGARLHVFSDEPELCKETVEEYIDGKNIELTWSTQKHDVSALYEMSLCCGGSIVANSSFSWWGAYYAHERNPKSLAFYPSKWGNPPLPPAVDIFPSWGIKVQC